MKLRNFFSRKKEITEVTTINETKKGVESDSQELEKFIEDWLKVKGWKFENFVQFIELAGVKNPIKVSSFNEKNQSFKCHTVNGAEAEISFKFGEFKVTQDEETRRYWLDYNGGKSGVIPHITLYEKVIKRAGKELSSQHQNYFCNRRLKLDSIHTLRVEIDKPSNSNKNFDEIASRNCRDIENYLLRLDNSLVVSRVYKDMLQFLGISKEDIRHCKKILISYIENADREERVLSKILVMNGEMHEYAIFEDGETFFVSRDGSWKYETDNIKIFYRKHINEYTFLVTGNEYFVNNANSNEIMKDVKERISELWKFVRE